MPTGRDWLAAVPASLDRQRTLLTTLLDRVEPDERWEWLELGCSVAAGRGDELSDVDVALGHAGTEPPPLAETTALLLGLRPVVDYQSQPWQDIHRWWVYYADGSQVDLVVFPAARRTGRAPGSVALLDRAGRLRETVHPQAWQATADQPREWLLTGWEALSNIAKYLHRGALLEALDQLQVARTMVFQLTAVAQALPYPSFGLTTLLDVPAATVPAGIEATYATVDRAAIRAAAVATAQLLDAAGQDAQPRLRSPLGPIVRARLHAPG